MLERMSLAVSAGTIAREKPRHRGTGVICDPYWSWWYGCTIGTVNFVTGSRSANSFGENIGAGLTFRLGESQAKIYAEARYHHAGYNRVATQLVPVTFGIRW